MSVTFKAEQTFDSQKARQYINNEVIVYHCHHYATLLSQLADDAKLINGPKLLAEASEEIFYDILARYFKENKIETLEDRISIVEQYGTFVGLGQLKLNLSQNSAEVFFSHVDEGWIKKWSKRDDPVNFIGQGYLAAAFSAINNADIGKFSVEEIQSIVSGSETSKFKISMK